METRETVCSLINCLTDNEDLRQELWVHYLSGNPVDSFSEHLEKLKSEQEDHAYISSTVWQLLKGQYAEEFSVVVEALSDYERSVMFLAILGFSVPTISERKGISQVRIRQTLTSIRYNDVWCKIYGVKDQTNRRRKVQPVRG